VYSITLAKAEHIDQCHWFKTKPSFTWSTDISYLNDNTCILQLHGQLVGTVREQVNQWHWWHQCVRCIFISLSRLLTVIKNNYCNSLGETLYCTTVQKEANVSVNIERGQPARNVRSLLLLRFLLQSCNANVSERIDLFHWLTVTDLGINNGSIITEFDVHFVRSGEAILQKFWYGTS